MFENIGREYKITIEEWNHDREEMFWSRSFCLMTTGGAPLEIIQKNIEHQREK